MRIPIIAFFCFYIFNVDAQTINYFEFEMGPKVDRYNAVGNKNVKGLLPIGIGAGVSLGKMLSEKSYFEVGLFKNDYSSNFEIISRDLEGQELTSKINRLYPTFSSTQLALMLGHRLRLSEKWTIYGEAGAHLFVNRRLDREGSLGINSKTQNDESGYEENIYVTIFSNGFESGSFLLRLNMGCYRDISETMAINFSISARGSSVVINEYEIQYTTDSEPQNQNAKLQTNGDQLGFYLGLKYRISSFSP